MKWTRLSGIDNYVEGSTMRQELKNKISKSIKNKKCDHEKLIRKDGTIAICEECGGFICRKCGYCFDELY